MNKFNQAFADALNGENGGLQEAVARLINENRDEQGVQEFVVNLVENGGLATGSINELIYTEDISKFFDAHYSDIEEIRAQHLEALDVRPGANDDLKTWYVLAAVEHVLNEWIAE